jgi:hypothetical protein
MSLNPHSIMSVLLFRITADQSSNADQILCNNDLHERGFTSSDTSASTFGENIGMIRAGTLGSDGVGSLQLHKPLYHTTQAQLRLAPGPTVPEGSA